MKYFSLFFLKYVASFSAPLDDVAAAARANLIVPVVIPSIDLKTNLVVNYSQPQGGYSNCGSNYGFPATQFDLNDTGITYVTPWNTRSYRNVSQDKNDFFRYVPDIYWAAANNTLYTLMMIDPLFIIDPQNPWGPSLQHYMVVNIIGNNISSGDLINPLLGPAAADPNYHKYVFVLYAQTSNITLSINETANIKNRVNFNVSAFLDAHNLTSAVGINWMYAMGDSWGPVEQDALGFAKLNCYGPVEAAARANGIVPNVLPSLNLTTRLRVSYNQPAGNFTNCDLLYQNPPANFSLNDTGATMQSPWNARSYRYTTGGSADYLMYQPDVSWNFTDLTQRYALVMIDAGPARFNSSLTGPYVDHWMVLNILGNNISQGDIINQLLGPAPMDDAFHVYTYVLYAQTGYITLSPEERAEIQTRRGFNLTSFAQGHNLTAPIGVNWLYSMADAFSPVVNDALNITKLNCLGAVEDAAKKNDIVPRIIPSLNLTTRLAISYDQPEGNYTNCGVSYNNPNASFSLNDTGVTTQTPFNLRSYRLVSGNKTDYFQYVPQINWTSEVATLYTLLLVDPIFIINASETSGPYVAHYVVTNIVGSDISSGNTINPLLGPAPIDPNYHKYLFLLYRQNGAVTIDANETYWINQRVNFDLPSFLSRHNFTTGPIGINWVYAMGDKYGEVVQDALGFAKLDCFGAVEEAAKRNDLVPKVIPSLNLTTRLSVRYAQPAASYTSCGTEYPSPYANFTLDDESVTNTTPWNMRSYRANKGDLTDYTQYQPEVHWQPESLDAYYTLMMVDPLFVINATHAQGPYFQHWMVINIPGNNTSGGDVVNPMLGPFPYEINTFHKYTFVLYKQQGPIALSGDERQAIQNRVNFNLPAFLVNHSLIGANGINWGYAAVDPWALVQADALDYLPLNCFAAVQNAASYLGIVPAIIPALNLDTQLRVTYNQPSASYTNCDYTQTPAAFNRSLSDTDVSKPYQTPWNLRSYRPLGLNKSRDVIAYTPQIDWEATTSVFRYTLLVVDPIYILDPQDPSGPYLNHMMVVNINHTDLASGLTVNPYFGPAPLNPPLYHKYLFLLYRQPGLINLTNAEITKLQTRTNFNLPDFVAAWRLGNPVGINWAFAQIDEWSAVAQDYIGLKPLKCPPTPAAPTPAAEDNHVHLSVGAFTAIAVIGSLIILVLLALVLFQRSAMKRKVGTDYGRLPGGEGRRA